MLTKTLHEGCTGGVVRDVQYLLAHNRFKNFDPGPVDGSFGKDTGAACVRAKSWLGYPSNALKPTIGPELFAYLLGPKRGGSRLPAAFLARAKVRQAKAAAARKAAQAKAALTGSRAKIVAYWRWGVLREPEIHYRQVRPFPVGRPYSLPMYTDCSGFFSLGYRVAGAPDPNGEGWSGQGYTGTLLVHGKRRSRLSDAKPGDAIVFGAYPGHHVCGVLESGSDPLLVSHGEEAGPRIIRFSAEHAAQGGRSYAVINYLG